MNFLDSQRDRNFYYEIVNASFKDSYGWESKFFVLARNWIKFYFKNYAHPDPPCPSNTP